MSQAPRGRLASLGTSWQAEYWWCILYIVKYFTMVSRTLALCGAITVLVLASHVMADAHVGAALALAATAGALVASPRNTVRSATIAVIALMGAIITATAFQWQLIDWGTVFLAARIEEASELGAAAGAGFAVAVGVRLWRTVRWRALAPVVASAAGYALWFLVPWTAINLEAVWYARHDGFDRVVALVRKGEIAGRGGDVALPSRWRDLSSDGSIEIHGDGDSLVVLFYTFRGLLGHASGYVYVAGDTPPTPVLLHSEIREIAPKEPHWYFVSLF